MRCSARRAASARVLLTAGLLLAGLLLAACSGGTKNGDRQESGGPTMTAAPPPLSPLTGLPLESAAVANRPAVTVKIDNAPQARPQAGLDKADVVIEEKVEGGVTRFLAVFHSTDADPVGPVRSVRSTDAPLVTPIGGVFAFAGGIPPFVELVRRAPVTIVTDQDKGGPFTLRRDRSRPHNTYSTTAKIRDAAGSKGSPPPRLFDLVGQGEEFAPGGVGPATRATVAFSPRVSAEWGFDQASGEWRRKSDGKPHIVEGGAQLSFTNVIIQLTPYRQTPFKDVAGNAVDEAVVVGSGDAVILSQGKQVRGRWSKSSDSSVIAYVDAAGTPVRLPPGRTWVMLPPVGAPVTVA